MDVIFRLSEVARADYHEINEDTLGWADRMAFEIEHVYLDLTSTIQNYADFELTFTKIGDVTIDEDTENYRLAESGDEEYELEARLDGTEEDLVWALNSTTSLSSVCSVVFVFLPYITNLLVASNITKFISSDNH